MVFMKDVIVLNRDRAPHFVPELSTAVISIHTPGDNSPNFPRDVFERVLELEFSDVNRSQYMKHHENLPAHRMVCFKKKDADKILDFVNDCLTHDIEGFLVHCDAGISRSPAVALAIREIYMLKRDIPRRWDLYNKTVYYEIMMAYHDRLSDGDWPSGLIPPIVGLVF